MAQLLQVGAGSGGMPVLDLVCRDPRLTGVTLVEPDVYQPHNVERHLFPPADVGHLKAELAARWLRERRPDLEIRVLPVNLLDPSAQAEIETEAARADLGVCAADNETAKFHFDALMRRHGKTWTLGEVLSGGIGGFVHWFASGGPCYGCVASHLQRTVVEDNAPPPDYSAPGGPVAEVRIPASKASINAIAALHALVTLQLLEPPAAVPDGAADAFGRLEGRLGFTTLLLPMQKVAGVFEEAFRPFRFRIPRAADCLICRAQPSEHSAVEDLDVALDQALARLGDA